MNYIDNAESGSIAAMIFDFDLTITTHHTNGYRIWDCPQRQQLEISDPVHACLLQAMYTNPQEYIKPGFLPMFHRQLSKKLPIYITVCGVPQNAIHMINNAYLCWCQQSKIKAISNAPLSTDNVVGSGSRYMDSGPFGERNLVEATFESIRQDHKYALLTIIKSKLANKGVMPNQALFIDAELDISQSGYISGNRRTASELGFQVLKGHNVNYIDGSTRVLPIKDKYLFQHHQFFRDLLCFDQSNYLHLLGYTEKQASNTSSKSYGSESDSVLQLLNCLMRDAKTLSYNIVDMRPASYVEWPQEKLYQLHFNDYYNVKDFINKINLRQVNGQAMNIYQNTASETYYFNCGNDVLSELANTLETDAARMAHPHSSPASID